MTGKIKGPTVLIIVFSVSLLAGSWLARSLTAEANANRTKAFSYLGKANRDKLTPKQNFQERLRDGMPERQALHNILAYVSELETLPLEKQISAVCGIRSNFLRKLVGTELLERKLPSTPDLAQQLFAGIETSITEFGTPPPSLFWRTFLHKSTQDAVKFLSSSKATKAERNSVLELMATDYPDQVPALLVAAGVEEHHPLVLKSVCNSLAKKGASPEQVAATLSKVGHPASTVLRSVCESKAFSYEAKMQFLTNQPATADSERALLKMARETPCGMEREQIEDLLKSIPSSHAKGLLVETWAMHGQISLAARFPEVGRLADPQLADRAQKSLLNYWSKRDPEGTKQFLTTQADKN